MLDYELKDKIEVFSSDNEFIGNSILMNYTDDALFISVPISNGIFKSLKQYRKIKIVYYSKKKIYGFNSLIIGDVMDNIHLYKINTPKEYHIIQRRKYVRVPMILEIKYLVLEYNEHFSLDLTLLEDVERYYSERIINCVAIDLSGEGIGIVVKENLRINDRMIIVVENSQINVTVIGKVTRKEKLKNKGYSYRIGIQFVDIENVIKEKIIQYVFKKMRKQLKSYIR